MRKQTWIHTVVGSVAGLAVGALVYLLVGGGEPSAAPRASSGPEQVRGRGDQPSVLIPRLRDERTEAVPESVARSDGLKAVEAVNETGLYFEQKIAHLLESFLTSEPDIIGWNLLLGELAVVAELDQGSVLVRDNGTEGQFKISGTDTRIDFEITDKGYNVVLRGDVSTSDIDHVGYRSRMSWTADHGYVDTTHTTVQLVPRDDYERDALDQRIIGYMYSMDAARTGYRPIRGGIIKGSPAIFISPPETNAELANGDPGSAYTWTGLLADIDTPEQVRRRKERKR